MHIPDGLLPASICVGGFAATGLMTWVSLRQINRLPDPSAGVPKAALLTAAFFVASSIHIPVPPTSIHLILNGLLGTVLGYYAFPAILVGLLLQAILLGHGGLTTLGVNAIIMGVPALLAAAVFRSRFVLLPSAKQEWLTVCFAFISGAIGLGLAVLIFMALILTNIPANLDAATERAAVLGLAIAHLPLMAIEGTITALLVLFLHRVKPEILER
jgi:cobalt/nickel transport system permease protein